jgi:ribosomal protein S12 methylthiotransferase
MSAYLKIAEGCSASCAFCTIPAIKGRQRSKPSQAVLREARELAALGAREIVLIAQDTTAYGLDLGMRGGLARLMGEMARAVPELPWLRLMYAYPARVTPDLIETLAAHPQICHYLDIPLQHAHPEVLRRMGRPHRMEATLEVLEGLRTALPDIALRTTFIVGYPGETEGEFETLLDTMREVAFDWVGIFPYHREGGTPAAELPGHLAPEVKEERYRRSMELAREITRSRNQAQMGRELRLLVEGVGDGISVGRTYRQAPEVDGLVLVEGERSLGEMPLVRITRALDYDLLAEVVG